MRLRALVPVIVLVFGLCLAVGARGSSASGDSPAGIHLVERTRTVQVGGYILEKHVLMDASEVSDIDATVTQVTGIGIEGEEPGSVTAQYVINPWKWPAQSLPVRVYYNPSLESPRPNPVPSIQDAVSQWSAVSPSTFSMTYSGATSATPGACDDVPDGINVVAYVTTLDKGVLGLTCSFRQASRPDTTVEFDMELAWGFDWGAGTFVGPNQYDVSSTILHEMGHAAGLGHSLDKNSVMYFALGKAQMKRSLTDDDKSALRAQYPVVATATTVSTPPAVVPTAVPIPVFNHFFAVIAPGVSRE